MTKTLAFFDRILVFILGILLLCIGFVPLAYFWTSPTPANGSSRWIQW